MYQPDKLDYLTELIARHTDADGLSLSAIKSLGFYRAMNTAPRCPGIDVPSIVIVCQGKKLSYVGDKRFKLVPGEATISFYPIPVETEVTKASEDEPLLLVGLGINRNRMANVLSRLDQIEGTLPKSTSADPSSTFTIPLSDNLLDPFIRLVELLDNPTDAEMLSNSIIDEIYYRLISQERGGELRALLQQRGDIQRIAKAISHIHENLNESISVDLLAELVHMSRTAFYKNFKDVMHMSPLQYAKAVKLNEAQRLIQEGKRANEAGYLVGYDIPAQFSRAYKQHFGYPPSATHVPS